MSLTPKFHAQFIRKDSRLTPSILHRVLFWTESLSKSVKTCDEGSTFAIPIFFPLNFYFHDFSVKNYLILYAKQKISESESSASFLKRSRGLKASVALFYPDLPWVPPPPPGPYYTPLEGWCSLYLKKSFILLFLFSFKCSHWLQLNEDLEGHIDFLAQTGPFSVPIRCVTKKCQVFSYHNHHPLTTQLWSCRATS